MYARQMSAWTYNILTSGLELLPSHYIENNYIFVSLQNGYREAQQQRTQNLQEQQEVTTRMDHLEDSLVENNSEMRYENKDLMWHKADVHLAQRYIDELRLEFQVMTPSSCALSEGTMKEYEIVLRDSETEVQCSVQRIESLKACKAQVSKHIQELKQTAMDLRDEEYNILERIWNIRIELQQVTALQPGVNARTRGA